MDACSIAATGVPIMKLMGGIANSDVVSEPSGQMHELAHGVAGFEFHNVLDSARTGDGQHVPGSCTVDHSSLQVRPNTQFVQIITLSSSHQLYMVLVQGGVWDFVKGAPIGVPMSYCLRSDEAEFCIAQSTDVVRLQPNADCATCPDDKLIGCCTFRYDESFATKASMTEKPELVQLSPLLLYISGLMPENEVPDDRKTYYCMGPDTDGGCGTEEGIFPCVYSVDDSNRNRITSNFVSRFTFDELVHANGGTRDPLTRAVNDLRHASIHIGQRLPSEAEMTFYTMLWRHHEVETGIWDRFPHLDGRRIEPLATWHFQSAGRSNLVSKLHSIPCGGGLQTPACTASGRTFTGCDDAPCGEGAVCSELDGHLICLCIEGLVGDGTKCVFPTDTPSHPLMDPYDLYPIDAPLFDGVEKCFGTSWPEFVPKGQVPPYPGGVAPYAATSCGSSSVCGVGWQCVDEMCVAPTSITMCEGHGYSSAQCISLGCCIFEGGSCKSAVGSQVCEPQVDPATVCEDLSTCCYFSCRDLEADAGVVPEISQRGNCGDCAIGIKPDILGAVHRELFMFEDSYYENGENYGYDVPGPLYVDGPTMYHRCFNACFSSQTLAPSPSPTPPPLPPPIPPGYVVCFSKANTVEHASKGIISMGSLQIGDFVRDTKNSFTMVYSFGHRSTKGTGSYLEIHATHMDRPLVMSKDHMIFVSSDGHKELCVPASFLKIGDNLVAAVNDSFPRVVTNIKHVLSEGAYAPFTASGSIAVNNIVASSYVALQEAAFFRLDERYATSFSMQWIAHAVNAPRRMMCQLVSHRSSCDKEGYNDEGISHWVAAPLIASTWLLRQHVVVVAAIFYPFVAILAMFTFAEYLLENIMPIGVAILAVYTTAHFVHWKVRAL